MNTDGSVPSSSSRPVKVTVAAAPGTVAAACSDPMAAAIHVPVARVPVTQLIAERIAAPSLPASPLPSAAPVVNAESLPDDPVVLKQMIAELLRTLGKARRHEDELQRQLDALLRRLHGPRPTPSNPNQPLLFPDIPADDTAVSPPPSPPPTNDEPPKSRRGKTTPHGRRRPPANLHREPHRHELTEAERRCPECGHDRREIGVDITEQYEYKPAELFVIEHQRVKYACPCCEGQVASAPKPAQPIDKGLPGPVLLAHIATDKYRYHLPLYRTQQRLLHLGADIQRSTMGDWMAAGAGLLWPLYGILKSHILQSKVLHTDDTTVPVRDESRTKHRYGRLWCYIGDADHPGIVFDYTATHARDGPATFLKDFQGFLQADAYGGYDGIYTGSKGTIAEVGCWAHARNKFAAAESTDPARALAAKAWVRKLYDVEDEAKELTSAERQRLRQEKSTPLLKSFQQWLLVQKTVVLPKSPIAVAINYALNQWEALNRYTTDGDLHIDNNLSERTLKLIGIGRLNWLFVGSDNGGKTAAVWFSFTAACHSLGMDAFAYLSDVLKRLPTHPADQLDELLPHRWRATRTAAAASGAVDAIED